MTLPLGSRLGRFEITGVLGEGAMGTVYLAHDPQIERPVAVKTLRLEGSQEQGKDLASRFLKEAKLAGRLQHPNIVTIYEAGRDQNTDFIAMEYVEGEPLKRLMTDPDFSLSERVEVVRQTALALEHAHDRGVLHRDIKPGNILITRDGRVKVADFGIGKLLEGAGDLTRTGQMLGSPAYMSPEQIRGEKLDGRSDFFSLGVVFYELLTGSRPFPGDTITTLIYQILHTEPRDPLRLRADLPPSTRSVFSRLLAKAPLADTVGYLHLDVDVMDPAVGQANYLPSPNGLSLPHLTAAISVIRARVPLGAAAVTSYSPEDDHDQGVSRAAFAAIDAILAKGA